MGISYSVEFQTGLDLAAISECIAKRFGFRSDPSHCGRIPLVPAVTLLANDFEMDVFREEHGKLAFHDGLGLHFNAQIIFLAWDSFLTQSEGGRQLAEIVNFLLGYCEGDFAFLFEGEQVLLKRSSSKIVINSLAGFWNENTRRAIHHLLTEEPLPYL